MFWWPILSLLRSTQNIDEMELAKALESYIRECWRSSQAPGKGMSIAVDLALMQERV
jgi:hypothetical protein